MAGPYPTALAACQAAPPCGFTRLDPKTGQDVAPATAPRCQLFEPGHIDPDSLDDHGQSQIETTTSSGDVLFRAIPCTSPPELRGQTTNYHAFVRRADGWWRSAPLIVLGYNDKYCGGRLAATWDPHGVHLVARVAAEVSCLTCGKQGDETTGYDLHVAIDQAGTAPATYGPIVTGEHAEQQLRADGNLARGETCPHETFTATLAERWPDPDTLVLTGPARWHALPTDAPGFLVWPARGQARSSVGTYRLVR